MFQLGGSTSETPSQLSAEDALRTIGRITVAPQLSLWTELANLLDEQTFFSPWHSLAVHRPLASVNRARRQTPEMSAEFRARFNRCPMHDTPAFCEVASGSFDARPKMLLDHRSKWQAPPHGEPRISLSPKTSRTHGCDVPALPPPPRELDRATRACNGLDAVTRRVGANGRNVRPPSNVPGRAAIKPLAKRARSVPVEPDGGEPVGNRQPARAQDASVLITSGGRPSR